MFTQVTDKNVTFVTQNPINMTERINKILKYYSLNSSQLADKIGVQRSSISHILSGRNKPSLDFIQKLMKVFPEITTF